MTTNTYKNAKLVDIGTTLTDLYTAPSDGTSTVIGLCIANTTSQNIFVDVVLYDDSGADTAYLVKEAPVPIGGGFVPIGGDQKIILESDDKIQVKSDTATSADAILSVLEIT